jgi:deoxycytidylate deaminase
MHPVRGESIILLVELQNLDTAIKPVSIYPKAEQPLAIDEAEIWNDYGQDVRDAFAMADVIVNTNDPHSFPVALKRFVEILFGNTLQTPTRDEQGMYLAQAAAIRSASLARQVGAVISREDGSVVGIGCNGVARPRGGKYWPTDEGDARDFRTGLDSSDKMRENLLADILDRLKKAEWLSSDKGARPTSELVRNLITEIPPGKKNPIMKGAQFTATIDYIRSVHAEMAAITDAARHGVSTRGAELYTTTFPCHDCAKHIVASGIKRVIFVEPYPKSLVPDLYADSIVVDSEVDCGAKVRIQPFVGIAPKRYAEWFALMKRRRKLKDGSVKVWRASDATPELPETALSTSSWLSAETEEFKKFEDQLRTFISKEKEQ